MLEDGKEVTTDGVFRGTARRFREFMKAQKGL
jgi:hypothetical protein